MKIMASPSRGSPLPYNGPKHDSGSTRASRNSARLFQPQQSQSLKCTIELEEVFGNTVTNSNAFDTLSDGTFALCSGSTAVVNTIAWNQIGRQRSFKAPTKRFTESPSGNDSTPNSPSRSGRNKNSRASILPGPGAPEIKSIFSKTAAVHRKPKGTSCLALSPNGSLLAVGESGFAPRILLFSLTSAASTPVAIVSVHASGIQTLSFSPDSKWLCSVGDIHDGFVHLWQITAKNQLKQCASSKCTSIVCQTKWIDDRSIVTAGVRHLKIWRPELLDQTPSPTKLTATLKSRPVYESPVPASPNLKSLSGRNVILDSLLDATFTSLCSFKDSKAIVASDLGSLSIFSVYPGTQHLTSIADFGIPVRCATFDDEKNVILVATDTDIWISTPVPSTSEHQWNFSRFEKAYHLTTRPLALGFVTNHQVICIDDRRRVSMYRLRVDQEENPGFDLRHITTYPTHPGSVNGSIVRAGEPKPSLLTYDALGHLVVWDAGIIEHDIAVPASLSDADPNEHRVIQQTQDRNLTVCGDRFGSMTTYDAGWSMIQGIQAHIGEINDIAIIESRIVETLVVTCGRDRAVQVFALSASDLQLAVLQTLEQHHGSVNKLEVVEQTMTLLLSLSSDRTIVIHALSQLDTSQAFICIRTITVKSTPLSCSLDPGDIGRLMVTTADKQLQIFQLGSGVLESSTKIVDEDDHQVAIQHTQARSIVIDETQTTLLIGISNTDKALRIHNVHGELICKASGHSEGISSLAILEEGTQADGTINMRIVTTSIEGTVMFWKLSCYSPLDFEMTYMKDAISPQEMRPSPLRKVLSRSTLTGFAAALGLGDSSPLPSPTREYSRSRKSSPQRLRRPSSMTFKSPKPLAELTPIITTPLTPRIENIVPKSSPPATESTSITLASEKLISNLRKLRTSLRGSTNDLDSRARHELKLELEMTLNLLSDSMGYPQLADNSSNGQPSDSSRDTSYFSAVNGMQNMSIAEE